MKIGVSSVLGLAFLAAKACAFTAGISASYSLNGDGTIMYKLWFYTDNEQLDYMSDDISKPATSTLSFPELVGQASHRRYPHSEVTIRDGAPVSLTVSSVGEFICRYSGQNFPTVTYVCVGAPDSALTLTNSCIAGSRGKKKGNGFNGYCCSTSDDCRESCIKGKCNGPKAPSTTTTTKSTGSPTPTPSSCISGVKGKKKGNGFNGYCCSTSDDCRESCIKGKCNGPKAPTTTTTTAQQCVPTNAKDNNCCIAERCQK
ncbi:hypothetical protein CU097_004289 [Rhizopus azygosporus]|uniref:Ig-like domain-containing protein n=1 Tax=Rhizopus azygosporus TaxID=86630 RepID=A0A367IT18_RHIAZ|nr:hypothetical protein CU097_004289 [Rhizopus azygosporus]